MTQEEKQKQQSSSSATAVSSSSSAAVSAVVESIQQRVMELEDGMQYEATKQAIRKVEEEFLNRLREIRAQMIMENNNNANAPSTTGSSKEQQQSSSGCNSNNKDDVMTTTTNGSGQQTTMATTSIMDALRAENDELRKKNTKLEYRVQHMVRSMEGMREAINK